MHIYNILWMTDFVARQPLGGFDSVAPNRFASGDSVR